VWRAIEESRGCAPRLRGVDALIQETSRCRKGRCSCWAQFGQAFSTLKSKILTRARVSRGSPVALLNMRSRCKPPKSSIAMRGCRALSHEFVPDRRLTRSRHSYCGRCRIVSRLTSLFSSPPGSRNKKLQGKLTSFPCRLITNHVSVPLHAKGEAPVLAAAAVTEFDAVPQ